MSVVSGIMSTLMYKALSVTFAERSDFVLPGTNPKGDCWLMPRAVLARRCFGTNLSSSSPNQPQAWSPPMLFCTATYLLCVYFNV